MAKPELEIFQDAVEDLVNAQEKLFALSRVRKDVDEVWETIAVAIEQLTVLCGSSYN